MTGSNTRALLLSGLTLVLISGISIFGFRLHRRNKQDLAALEQVLKK
ncbi:LPXTG cell wall anchor domain-containing protein [Amylolactobacillus amylophilus]